MDVAGSPSDRSKMQASKEPRPEGAARCRCSFKQAKAQYAPGPRCSMDSWCVANGARHTTTSIACSPHLGRACLIGAIMAAPPLPLVLESAVQFTASRKRWNCACVVSRHEPQDLLAAGWPAVGGCTPADRRSCPWKMFRGLMQTSRGQISSSLEAQEAAVLEVRLGACTSAVVGAARFKDRVWTIFPG